MEQLLERLFVDPGDQPAVGLDVILDLVPVVGDIAGGGTWRLHRLGSAQSRHVEVADCRMAGNVGIDWLLGLIPFVGAIPDFFFRSNTRNLRIIKRHLDKHHAGTATIEGQAAKHSLAAPDFPFVLALDFVRDGAAVTIRARAIDEALLDETASQGVEFGNAARSGNRAAGHAAVDANREQDADCAADPRLSRWRG